MVLARVDAQGKMQIDGRKFAGLYAVVAAELQFAAAVSSGNDQAIAAGAHRNAGSGFFFARSAYAPVHFAADGVDGGCCVKNPTRTSCARAVPAASASARTTSEQIPAAWAIFKVISDAWRTPRAPAEPRLLRLRRSLARRTP